ncbi:MAG: GerAB/ArcD/ProY family transporter [Lachnospiraceae bacterium]
MFSDNEQISTRQAFRLLVFELLGITTLILPQVLAKYSRQDGVFALLFGIIFSMLYVRLLKGETSEKEDIFTLLTKKKRRKLLSVVRVFYLGLFVCLAAVTVYETALMIQHLLLRMDSFYLIVVILLVLSVYGIRQGMEGRARIFEVLFWFLLIPLIIMLLFACKDVRTDYWCPVFTANPRGFCKGTLVVFLFFHISGILFLEEQRHVKKYIAARAAILVVGILNIALYLILLGMFQWNLLSVQKHPALVLMSMVRLPGGFLRRQDAILAAVWFFSLYALLNACVYQSGRQLQSLLKKEKPENCRIVMALVIFILTVFLYRKKGVLDLVWNVILPIAAMGSVLLIWGVKKKMGTKMKLQKSKCMVLLACVLSSLIFSGCSKRELEKSSYPMEILIANSEKGELSVTFSFPKLEEKADQNIDQKKSSYNTVTALDLSEAVSMYERDTDQSLDCNHVKALVFTENVFQNKEEWTQILRELWHTELLARNVPVFLTKDAERYLQASEQTDTSAGEYLEGLVQNQTQRKNKGIVTLGTLFMQMYSQNETIFIPKLTVQKKVPVIGKYQVMRYMEDAGAFSVKQEEMASLIAGNLNRYTFYLKDNTHVQLTYIHTQYHMKETKNGVHQIISIAANAAPISGKIWEGSLEKKRQEEAEQTLQMLLTEETKNWKRQQIDLTNSYVRLGAKSRQSWFRYTDNEKGYEENLQTEYRVRLTFVTDE